MNIMLHVRKSDVSQCQFDSIKWTKDTDNEYTKLHNENSKTFINRTTLKIWIEIY